MAQDWFDADDRMQLLHHRSEMRFAQLPRDLRIAYIGPMVLWPWRIVSGAASGQLLLQDPNGLCCLSGGYAGFNNISFVQVRGPRNNIVTNGEFVTFCGRRDLYGRRNFYEMNPYLTGDRCLSLLGQTEITCVVSTAIIGGNLHVSVARPEKTGYPITPSDNWHLERAVLRDVPSCLRIVLWRRDVVLWDGQRWIRRIVGGISIDYRIDRTPVSVTEGQDGPDTLWLTYAAGDFATLDLAAINAV